MVLAHSPRKSISSASIWRTPYVGSAGSSATGGGIQAPRLIDSLVTREARNLESQPSRRYLRSWEDHSFGRVCGTSAPTVGIYNLKDDRHCKSVRSPRIHNVHKNGRKVRSFTRAKMRT